MKKIVILGGGFGGVYALKYLHRFFHRSKDIKLVLVNKKNYFLFTPLLAEAATGGISLDNAIEPIREIIKCCDWDFVHGEVKKIDLENKIVFVDNFTLDYDYLVIALGSKTNYYGISGAEKYTFSLKSADEAIRLKNQFVHCFEKASLDPKSANKFLTFVVVGGGATGVELAGEMSDLLYKTFGKLYSKEIFSKVRIILIERAKELIPQFPSRLRVKALNTLKKKGVEVLLEKGVVEVGEDFIKLDDGSAIETKTVIWTAGVMPNIPEILGNIEKDDKGRFVLNEHLQVKNYENVFAIGDICCFIQDQKPLPQLAQVATRQAKTASLNIKNLIENKKPEKFVYKHTGDLVSIGRFYAVGEIRGISFSGIFAWFLWRGVYLVKMVSFRDQVKTLMDWLLNLFLPRDITEL